jgi:uncharacterized repeat protein (TIGR01451 family)
MADRRVNWLKLAKNSGRAAWCIAFGMVGFNAAYAEGTLAGSEIENTFVLDYKIGATQQDTITNDPTLTGAGYDVQGTPTTFTVDRVVDLTIQSLNSPLSVDPGEVSTLEFELTNTGNDRQSYSFSLADISSDDFDTNGLVINYCTDGNDDGDYTDPEDDCDLIVQTPVGTTGALAIVTEDINPDETILIQITGHVSSHESDGETDSVIIVAETRNPIHWMTEGATLTHRHITTADSNGTNELGNYAENVLADGTGFAPEEGNSDGLNAAEGTFAGSSPDLSASKTVTVIRTTPVNCATDTAGGTGEYTIPGACVEYVIEVTNNGATETARDLVLADQLPSDVSFVAASFTAVTTTGFDDDPEVAGTGPLLTEPTSGTICDGTNCLVQLSDAQLAAGETGRIIMRALIN